MLGPDGDEVLRSCLNIEQCEVVFDPNFEGGYFSGVKAGLHAVRGAAFVVPLATQAPEDRIWEALEAAGLHAVSLGLSALAGDDDHGLLERGFVVYDALFAWARHAADERHNWPAKKTEKAA